MLGYISPQYNIDRKAKRQYKSRKVIYLLFAQIMVSAKIKISVAKYIPPISPPPPPPTPPQQKIKK